MSQRTPIQLRRIDNNTEGSEQTKCYTYSVNINYSIHHSIPQTRQFSQAVLDTESGFVQTATEPQQVQQTLTEQQKTEQRLDEFCLRMKLKLILNRMLQHCETSRFLNLTERQYQIISDVASDFNYKLYKTKKTNFNLIDVCFNKLYWKLCIKIDTFNPNSLFCLFWNSIHSIWVTLFCYLLSIHIFFKFDLTEIKREFDTVLFITMILQISDILVQLNTTYYKKGKLEADRKHIAKYYRDNYSIPDVCSFATLAYFFYYDGNDLRWWSILIQFLYFTKCIQIYRHSLTLEKVYVSLGQKSWKFDFVKLLWGLIVTCHLVSILWILLARLEYKENLYENIWMRQFNLTKENWVDMYFQAFFWSLSTMMLIGSSPNNNVELVFTSFVILFTVGIFAYIINEIGTIMSNLKKETQTFKDELSIMSKFMIQQGTSNILQQKIRSYMEYNYSNQRLIQINHDVQRVIEKLPQDLQEGISKEINAKVLDSFPVLCNNLGSKTLDSLFKTMEEKLYIQGETIHMNNEYHDIAIYLILDGKVQISTVRDHDDIEEHKKEEILIKVCKKGDIFGTTGNYQEFVARCLQTCRVRKIHLENLESILREHPMEFEKFKMIKDTLLMPRNIKRIINQSCQICKKFTHAEHNCNWVHYSPTLMRMVKVYRSHNRMARFKFQRNQKQNDSSSNNSSQRDQSIYVPYQDLILENSEQDITKIEDEQEQKLAVQRQQQLDQIKQYFKKQNSEHQDSFINQTNFTQRVNALKSQGNLHYLARKIQDLNNSLMKHQIDQEQFEKWLNQLENQNKIYDQYYKTEEFQDVIKKEKDDDQDPCNNTIKGPSFYWIWLTDYLREQNIIHFDKLEYENNDDEDSSFEEQAYLSNNQFGFDYTQNKNYNAPTDNNIMVDQLINQSVVRNKNQRRTGLITQGQTVSRLESLNTISENQLISQIHQSGVNTRQSSQQKLGFIDRQDDSGVQFIQTNTQTIEDNKKSLIIDNQYPNMHQQSSFSKINIIRPEYNPRSVISTNEIFNEREEQEEIDTGTYRSSCVEYENISIAAPYNLKKTNKPMSKINQMIIDNNMQQQQQPSSRLDVRNSQRKQFSFREAGAAFMDSQNSRKTSKRQQRQYHSTQNTDLQHLYKKQRESQIASRLQESVEPKNRTDFGSVAFRATMLSKPNLAQRFQKSISRKTLRIKEAFGPSTNNDYWDDKEQLFFDFDKTENFKIYQKNLNFRETFKRFKNIQKKRKTNGHQKTKIMASRKREKTLQSTLIVKN